MNDAGTARWALSFGIEKAEAITSALASASAAPDARVVAKSVSAPGIFPGLTAWRGRDLHPDVSAAVRIVPDDLWDGFFVCRIEKPA